MKKILFLAANPKNTDRLGLDEEVREIEAGLRRSRHRDQFELVTLWAVRSRDFYRAMLDVQPHIVHFSGHGGGDHGIVLEDDANGVEFVSTEQLAKMFKLFASRGVECVLLNACYSTVQADAISHYVDVVIGMNKAIGDKAAVNFAAAFYDSLGAGETYEFAFDLACTQIVGVQEHETPIFKCNQRATGAVRTPLSPTPASMLMKAGASNGQSASVQRSLANLPATAKRCFPWPLVAISTLLTLGLGSSAVWFLGEREPDISGVWETEVLPNQFDPDRTYILRFDLDVEGDRVFGTLHQVLVQGDREMERSLLEGSLEGHTVTFQTQGESTVGAYHDFYYGTIRGDQIEFKLTSDRADFLTETFTATQR